MKKSLFSFFLSLVIIFGSVPIAYAEDSNIDLGSSTLTLDICNGNITTSLVDLKQWYTQNGVNYATDGPVIIKSTTTSAFHFSIYSGNPTVFFDNLNITTSDTSPIKVFSGASLDIYLLGNSVIKCNAYATSAYGNNDIYAAGILVQNGASLVIRGTGSITCSGGQNSSGIGGGMISGKDGSCGIITINDGTVYSSTIGGGVGCSNGTVIINGGIVEAKGSNYCAGIGCGNVGSFDSIKILGGNITAVGDSYSAAIGVGYDATCKELIIKNCTVNATGGMEGAGIGAGNRSTNVNVTIENASVSAIGGYDASGIGSGPNGSAGTITITASTVSAIGKGEAAGIGGGASAFGGKVYIYSSKIKASGAYNAIGGGLNDDDYGCDALVIDSCNTDFTFTKNPGMYDNLCYCREKIAIKTQPQNAYALMGGSASFSVEMENDNYLYQWQISSDGAIWTDLSNQTLSDADIVLTEYNEGYKVRCVVSNLWGNSVNSSSASINKFSILTQPSDISVNEDSIATLSIGLEGNTSSLQWQKSLDGGLSWSDVYGANSYNYIVLSASINDSGLYRCVITLSESNVIYSNTAKITVNGVAATGSCGTNITYTLSNDGELVLSGSGKMDSYTNFPNVPWYSYCSYIKSVSISEGITSIGDYAFHGCSSLICVNLPSTITSIGKAAFAGCSFDQITLPNGLVSIGDYAFNLCSELEGICLPQSLTKLGKQVFAGSQKISYYEVNSLNEIFDSRDDCNAIIETETNTLICGCSETMIPDTVVSIGESAFFSCNGLVSIDIPNSVTNIGRDAFRGCSNLKNLKLSDNLVSIGIQSFYGCNSIECVELPNTVTKVAIYAFSNCQSLHTVYISRNLTSKLDILDAYTFSECASLCNIFYEGTEEEWNYKYNSSDQFRSTLTQATVYYESQKCGDYAYWSFDSNLGKLTIGGMGSTYDYNWDTTPWFEFSNAVLLAEVKSGITELGNSFFDVCQKMTNVSLPEGLEKIGDSCFDNCYVLSNLIIPSSVISLGDSAFAFCHALEEIELPENLLSIGDGCFVYCTSLIELKIPASVKNIGTGIVSGCNTLNNISISENNSCYKTVNDALLSKDGTLFICPLKSLHGTYTVPDGVEIIGSGAFASSNVSEIVLPDSVIEIQDSAFNSSSLCEINLPSSLRTIGNSAFQACWSLHELTIPEGMTVLTDGALRNFGLRVLNLPSTLESFGPGVVDACFHLETINVASTSSYFKSVDGALYSKDETAIYVCPASKSGNYTILNGVTDIKPYAFSYCASLSAISVPDSVNSIGEEAFFSCESLEQIHIPDGVTAICRSTFQGCSSLKNIQIPNSVLSIEPQAFDGCGLEGIVIPDSVESLGYYAFCGCENLKNIYLSSNIDKIEDGVFQSCSSLKTLILPENITSIGFSNFYNTHIESLVLLGENTYFEDWSVLFDELDDTEFYIMRDSILDISFGAEAVQELGLTIHYLNSCSDRDLVVETTEKQNSLINCNIIVANPYYWSTNPTVYISEYNSVGQMVDVYQATCINQRCSIYEISKSSMTENYKIFIVTEYSPHMNSVTMY